MSPPDFFAEHTLVPICSPRTDYWLGQQGRLTHPMYRAAGGDRYRPISWNDAFAADRRASCAALDAPDEAAFYTSGRTSNEAAFLYQLFVRMLGTNNLPDCSNMCHESQRLGADGDHRHRQGQRHASTTSTRPICILVVGQNPGTNHPRMLTALEEAKRRGARIIAVNPLPEAGLIRFKNPQRPWASLGGGTRAGGPVPADQAGRRPGAVPGLQPHAAGGRGRGARHGPRHRFHRPVHARLRRSSPSTPAGLDWDDILSGHRPGRGRDRGRVPPRPGRRERSWSAGRWGSPSTGTRSPPSGRS